MRWSIAVILAMAAAVLGAAGCSSISSSAVRTDGLPAQAHVGAVRVYGVMQPAHTHVVGVVDVSAVQDEANLEALMPVFTRRVAELGGTGGVVDSVTTAYEWRTEMRMQSFSYPCGRMTCFHSQLVPYTYEVRVLSIHGRAILPDGASPTTARPAIPITTAPPTSELKP